MTEIVEGMTKSYFQAWLDVGVHWCSHLSGAGVDVLGSALIPVGQQLDGGGGCTEPQQLWNLLVQETVIVEQVLVQHRSEEDMGKESFKCVFLTYVL